MGNTLILKASDAELKLLFIRSKGIMCDLCCTTGTLTWQSASEQTLPTADNSVPLLEPQKRHASELLVVGLPRFKHKKEKPSLRMFSTYFSITNEKQTSKPGLH